MRERLLEAGVALLADSLSLRERGMEPVELHAKIEARPLEHAVELLEDPAVKAVFH